MKTQISRTVDAAIVGLWYSIAINANVRKKDMPQNKP
jgi:hypothetical protein